MGQIRVAESWRKSWTSSASARFACAGQALAGLGSVLCSLTQRSRVEIMNSAASRWVRRHSPASLSLCLIVVILLGAAASAQAPEAKDSKPKADAIYIHGNIYTGVPAAAQFSSVLREEAIAVRGDRIQAVGKKVDIEKLKGPQTQVIDLGGRFVMPGFNDAHLHLAYAGLKKHATQEGDPGKGYGRVGIREYLRLGYLPADTFGGAVAQTLDLAYGDFCIAQVARAAGAEDDAAMFEKRSANWKHVFDAEQKFMRGKLADGRWLEPFDQYSWGGAYVEGGAWQYRFSAWHDADGLIARYGGRGPFLQCLEQMLQQPPRFRVGAYGTEIHEMSEMAAVDFGQYAHSNQPVHNVLYLFTAAGRRDRTQYWVHRVLNELYSPDNFAGDEDTGATSAWYILSALGLFALCPGKPEWSLGAPLFPSVSIHFSGGRQIRIEAHRKQKAAFYDRVTVNGSHHEGPVIAHAVLMQNAHIVFSAT